MDKRHLIKSIEMVAVLVFALIQAYLAVTGILLTTGIDHAWSYPSN